MNLSLVLPIPDQGDVKEIMSSRDQSQQEDNQNAENVPIQQTDKRELTAV